MNLNNLSSLERSKVFSVLLIFILLLFGLVGLLASRSTQAASITWDGGGADNNWSTAANWSTDTVPTTADIVIFDATSVKDATIDLAFIEEVNGIDINSGYTGTITMGQALTVGNGDFAQDDGTFDCVSYALTFQNADVTIAAGATFTEGTGSVLFTGSGLTTLDVATSETFYDVTINKSFGITQTIASGDTMVVSNDLTLTDGKINTGTVDTRGNITQSAAFDGGTATLDFGDDSTAQTYTTAGGVAPIIRFDAAADANDEVVFNADASFRGLRITSGFGANPVPLTYNTYDLTIGVDNYTQEAGTFTAPSTMTLYSADFTKTGGTFVEGTNTIEFTSSLSTVDVATSETFYNVIVNNTSSLYVTIASGDTMVVSNDLTLTDGKINTGTVSVLGDIFQSANFDGGTATLDFDDDSTAQTYTTAGGWGPLISFDAVADASDSVVFSADAAFYGMEIASGFGANTVPLTYGGFNLTIGAGNYTQEAGTFTAPSTMTMATADFTKTGGTFVEGTSTVIFSNGYSGFDVATSETFYNVSVNNSVSNQLNINASDTLVVSNTLILTEGSVSGGTLETQGDVTVESGYDGGTAMLKFTGTSTQTFNLTGATDKYNGDITVNKSSGQVNLASALTMNANNQDLIIEEGTFDLNGNNLSVTAGSTETIVVNSGGNLQLQGGETITGDSSAYPQLDIGSTVTYDGSSTYTMKDYTYSNLTINGSGTFSLAATETINNVTITSGILALAGNGLTVSTAFSNEDTFQLQGGETVSIIMDTDSGTVTFVGDGDAVADTYTVTALATTYNNLTINSADGATDTFQLGGALDVNNDFNVMAGTFDVTATNYGLTVGRNFANSGTFTAQSGTVTFDDATKTSVVSGSTSFSGFSCTTSNKNIQFTAGTTQSVTGDFTLTGTLGNLIVLRSTLDSSAWNLNVSGTQDVTYVDTKDSDASLGNTIDCGDTCTDSTGNTNWTFTSNTVPTATSVTASQVTDGSGTVTLEFIMNDADGDDTLEALVEYDIGGGWTKATLSEDGGDITATYGTPDVENDDTYQVGNALGYITSSSGANTISVIWNASVDEPTADVAAAQIRITPYDGTGAGSTSSSSTFSLDVVAPTFVQSDFRDTNIDGVINFVSVEFDEDVSLTYDDADWSIPEGGSLNITDETNASVSDGNTVFLWVSADANETGATVSPTVLYTNNGDRLTDTAGNPVSTFGSAQTVADNAEALLLSISPADGATAGPLVDVVYTFSEAMDTASVVYDLSETPTGIIETWTENSSVLTISHTGEFSGPSVTADMTSANDATLGWPFGNVAGFSGDSTFSINTVPTASSVTASQVTDGSGTVTIEFTLDDSDDDDTLQAFVEYDIGGGWTKATLSETDGDTTATYGDPKVENDDSYQVGNASGYITTSSGVNTVTTIWNASTDEATADVADAQIRITPYDGTGAGTPATSLTFALDVVAPTYSSSRYYDNNADGTIDRVDVVFSENVTLSSYSTSDWSFTEAGSMTLDDSGASASTTTVTLTVTADANETGGATEPTILYTNNAGRLVDAVGNPVATFGVAQTITDDADPYIVSISPAHGATAQTTDDIVVTFTEPINTGTDAYTLTNGPTGQSTVWTSGTTLTISHTGPFTVGSKTFTMTVASDLTGNTLAGAIVGITHPVTFLVTSTSSSTSNIDYVSNNSIEINTGDTCTTNPIFNVALKASNATDYLLSLDSTFQYDSWNFFEPTSTDGTGSDGKTIRVMTIDYPVEEASGTYALYAKFRSRSGNVSSLSSDTVTLDLENNCGEITDTGDTTDATDGTTGDTDTTDDTSDQGDADSGEKPNYEDIGTSPFTGEEEAINVGAIEPGRFLQGFNFPEVYWIGNDYRRHTFFNAFTFFTYETSREVIKLVSDATLAQLDFGKALGPKPGSVLIKFQSADEVYYIEENPNSKYKGILRHITTEEMAEEKIGDNWKDYILELEPTFFERFIMADPLTDEDVIDITNLVEVFELEQAALRQ